MRKSKYVFVIAKFLSIIFSIAIIANTFLNPAFAVLTEKITPPKEKPSFNSTSPFSIQKDIQKNIDEQKNKIASYAPGEIIIKFKDAAGASIDSNLSVQTLEVPPAKTGIVSVNALNTKYHVKKIAPVFRSSKEKQNKSGKSSLQLFQDIRNKFPNRSKRTPKNVSYPNRLNIYRVEFEDKNSDVLKLSEAYQKDPNVEYAEPNYIIKTTSETIAPDPGGGGGGDNHSLPNDTYVDPFQTGTWTTGTWGNEYEDMWGLQHIRADLAWGIERGQTSPVIVAVIDTGLDYNHPDIVENVWSNSGEIANNGIDDDGNGFVDDVRGYDFTTCQTFSPQGVCVILKSPDNDPMDDMGHGTHVSGTIAAIPNNGIGIAGISWNAKIMAIKGFNWQGYGLSSDLANSIYYAIDNGADILNLSWGARGTIQLLSDALAYAHNSGITIVGAAGNSYSDVADFFPGNQDEVIAVSATDSTNRKSYFSNWGPKIDVAAPGGDLPSDGNAYRGRNILSLRAHNTDMYGGGACIIGEDYYLASGTSMAAPHASGVAALIYSIDSQSLLTPDMVKMILEVSAQDIFKPGKDIFSGYGLVDAYQALVFTREVIQNPSLPELLITDNFSAIFYKDNQMETHIEIANAGFSQTTAADYKIYAGDSSGGVVLDEGVVPSLAPGERYAFTKMISLVNFPNAITLVIDSQDIIHEYSKVNNKATIIPKIPSLPGWPMVIRPTNVTPTLADLDGDGILEIILVTSGFLGEPNQMNVYVYRIDGTLMPGWPQAVNVSQLDPPVVADLDGDGIPEVVVTGDNSIYAWHVDGTPVAGWPQHLDGDVSARPPAVADLDHDGIMEIIVGVYPDKIYVFHADGTPVAGWPQNVGPARRFRSTTAVADLDGDGNLEVIAVAEDPRVRDIQVYVWRADGTPLPGWPQTTNYWDDVRAAPAIADLNNDGKLEIVVRSDTGNVYVLRADGTPVAGWPQHANGLAVFNDMDTASPAIADLDGDGIPEVVVGSTNHKVYAWHADGTPLPSWPQETAGRVSVALAIADLDGDGTQEVIATSRSDRFSDENPYLYAWHADGTPVAGWPIYTVMPVSSVIADLDGDGTLEVVVLSIGGLGWNIDIKTLPWNSSEPMPWPMFQKNRTRTGSNAVPLLNFIGPKYVSVGSSLIFQIKATDADNDSLIYSATGLPPGATFNSATKTFVWLRAPNKTVAYSPTFTVTDNHGASNSETVQIHVVRTVNGQDKKQQF